MSTLTNQQINLTYAGLIKTNDNLAIDATPKFLEDGVGNTVPMKIGTTEIQFTDTVDFSAATVTGLAAGGLVAGTGTDSMKSAAFLTTSPANASGGQSTAIGNAASATNLGTIAIGNGASASGNDAIAIGISVNTTAQAAITLGRFASATGSVAVSIGNGSNVNADNSIGISAEAVSISGGSIRGIAIGRQATLNANNAIAIGNYAKVTGYQSFSFTSCGVNINDQKAPNSMMMVPGDYGCTTNGAAINSIVLGSSNSQLERATINALRGIAIGYNTVTNAAGAVALGADIVANRADTTSVAELETKTVGGGVIMYSPDGTAYKLTVANGGTLTVTAI